MELPVPRPARLGAAVADHLRDPMRRSAYALILATGLLGVIINLVMRMIERRVLSWYHGLRRAQRGPS